MKLAELHPATIALRWRLWWNAPHGHHRVQVVGPSDWELAAAPESAQIEAILNVVPGSTSLRWIRAAGLAGYRDDEAFRVEAADESTGKVLTAQLLHRARDGSFHESLSWLLGYAVFQRRGFAHIRFEEKDGKLLFHGLRLYPVRAIRREGSRYLYEPAKQYGGGASHSDPVVIPSEEIIDVQGDLPVASDEVVRRIIASYWDDRIETHRSLAAAQVAAQPELRGLRWDAARIRRLDAGRRPLIGAQISYDLGESLMERAMFFDEPEFTRDFLLWQHHRAMTRIGELREAMLSIVNRKIVERLVKGNGLAGEARLIAVGVHPQAELDSLYEQLRDSKEPAFTFYEKTVPGYMKIQSDRPQSPTPSEASSAAEETNDKGTNGEQVRTSLDQEDDDDKDDNDEEDDEGDDEGHDGASKPSQG